jgi:hypothetical protein
MVAQLDRGATHEFPDDQEDHDRRDVSERTRFWYGFIGRIEIHDPEAKIVGFVVRSSPKKRLFRQARQNQNRSSAAMEALEGMTSVFIAYTFPPWRIVWAAAVSNRSSSPD